MTACQLLLFSLLMLACGSAPSQPAASTLKPLMNIRDIANQTQEDIATILGPQSSLDSKDAKSAVCANCQKYSYQNDRIIIEYTNDMADRITIRPAQAIPASQLPVLLGLPDLPPDRVTDGTLHWVRYEGMREITAFLDEGGTVRHIVVKVTTL